MSKKINFATGNRQFAKKEAKKSVLSKDINLLPRELIEQRNFDRAFRNVYFSFIRLFIIAVILLAVPYTIILTTSHDKDMLNEKISKIAAIEELEGKVLNSRNILRKKQKLISDLNKSDSIISVVLTTMEKVMPKSMYLNSVNQTTEEVSGTGVKKVIRINGVAKDKDAVAQFQKSLKETNMYESIFVTDITEYDERKENVITITDTNSFGEVIEKQAKVLTDFKIKVEFKMECILKN